MRSSNPEQQRLRGPLKDVRLAQSTAVWLQRINVEWAGSGPTCLRHSCAYFLADKGTGLRTMQDYLSHRDPKHTAHYSRAAGSRFEGLWR